MEDEKEDAGTSIKIAIEFITPGLMKYRRKKETTIIVDVDNKNC